MSYNIIYTIHVYAGNFADSDVLENSQKQEFSVVTSGPIKNGYIEFSESFECPCDECDSKHPGFCLCNEETEIGPIISLLNILKLLHANRFKSKSYSIKYFTFLTVKTVLILSM